MTNFMTCSCTAAKRGRPPPPTANTRSLQVCAEKSTRPAPCAFAGRTEPAMDELRTRGLVFDVAKESLNKELGTI